MVTICGLAGYNCSPEWAASYIDQNKQFKMLEAAWRYNQHRGTDSVGYMMVKAEDSDTIVQKWGLSTKEMMEVFKEKKIELMSAAKVLGAHTRNFTIGSPAIPVNNHPVEYADIYVTHNGHISNHDKIRLELVKNKKKRDGNPSIRVQKEDKKWLLKKANARYTTIGVIVHELVERAKDI